MGLKFRVEGSVTYQGTVVWIERTLRDTPLPFPIVCFQGYRAPLTLHVILKEFNGDKPLFTQKIACKREPKHCQPETLTIRLTFGGQGKREQRAKQLCRSL